MKKCVVCEAETTVLVCRKCFRAYRKSAEGSGIPGAVAWAARRVRRQMTVELRRERALHQEARNQIKRMQNIWKEKTP